ncbi:MAG TPA: DUF1801 domain-containing protein [Flavobacteriales bacterium]|nr:DUF1801 domain-containing protein [Flavobacteriales bacterium]
MPIGLEWSVEDRSGGAIFVVSVLRMPKPNKTKATTASVTAFVDKHPKEGMRDDSRVLMAMMQDLTGEEPHMYGPSIIGFGTYHYIYASGHSGSAPLAAFSPRKTELVIYLGAEVLQAGPLAKLGRHRATKGCLYVKRLSDIDLKVLKTLLKKSIAATRKAWPQ